MSKAGNAGQRSVPAKGAKRVIERRVAEDALRASDERSRPADAGLTQSVVELRNGRRAALNLMEDAVRSRQAMEMLNAALRESEERYRTLFMVAPMAVFVCDNNAVIQQYNERAVELWGREPVRGVERHCGSQKLWLPDGTHLPHTESPVVEVLRSGVPVLNVEVFIERPDGSRLPVLVNFAPLRNAAGEITGAITSFTDISDRKRAEVALQESERRFREMIDALPTAIYTTDAEGRITHFNPAAVKLAGRTPELGADRWCVSWKLYHADGTPMSHDECPMAIALKEGRIIDGAEAILERPDGQRFWFTPYPTPLRDRDGRIVGGINMLVDITERKQAEQRQQLLMNELAHRGKNLLAVIQTIVSRSLFGSQSLAEARESLMRRIQALAHSQTILVNGAFEGAPLAEIIRLEFEGFPGRVNALGPDVMLNPKATQTFALLAHELATNATKYGALSQPGGTIAINWSIEDNGAEARFQFQWQERDGPPVVAPKRHGFGRVLIEKAVAQDFGSQPKISYAPEGLSYEIDAPLSAVAAERGGDDNS